MTAIRIIDCTLRDGGCVNDFCFEDDVARQIYAGLKQVHGIGFVEVGYLNERRGTSHGRTQFDRLESARRFTRSVALPDRSPSTDLLMIDLGTFDVHSLPSSVESGFGGIRLAFHRSDLDRVADTARVIAERDYQLFLQPMLTLDYAAADLAALFATASGVAGLTALYIVDSFGQMTASDVARLLTVYEQALAPTIGIGFHAHDNLGQALANCAEFVDGARRGERAYYVDGSLGGMGKGGGNAKVEELLAVVPDRESSPDAGHAAELAAALIDPLRQRWQWGPSDSMAVCARLHATPSYHAYFRERGERPESELADFLATIAPAERIVFNSDVAARAYAATRAAALP